MAGRSKWQLICSRQELAAVDYLVRPIQYRHNETSAIIFYFRGEVYAYINLCMHMQRRLDCQEDTLFDAEGRYLHCSMHGFVFEPTTGECLSPVCAGEKLQALKVTAADEQIYFSDKHVKLIA